MTSNLHRSSDTAGSTNGGVNVVIGLGLRVQSWTGEDTQARPSDTIKKMGLTS